jgi:hypothetical protein
VSFYLGKQRLGTTVLRAGDEGRRTLTLKPARRKGNLRLRAVYAGDSRYQRLDSKGPSYLFAGRSQYVYVYYRNPSSTTGTEQLGTVS